MKELYNIKGEECDEGDLLFAKKIGINYYVLCDGIDPINLEKYNKKDTTYKLRLVSKKSFNYYLQYLQTKKEHYLNNSRRTIDV